MFEKKEKPLEDKDIQFGNAIEYLKIQNGADIKYIKTVSSGSNKSVYIKHTGY